MLGHPSFIRNASTIKSQSEKKVMDGIVSGSLNTFQHNALNGLLKGGQPAHSSPPSGNKPEVMKAKGKVPKTQLKDGYMPYPGSGKN
jgi:hypothetical protein